MYKILRQKITLSASDSVLDFGSGTGLLGFNFANEAGSLSFADTSAEMLKQAQRKAQDLGITVSTLNLSQSALSGSYNVVASLLALHHKRICVGR
ncbi:MAG: class I SAM-dependent methyltransferase [Helicobacteraceae bacterium]